MFRICSIYCACSFVSEEERRPAMSKDDQNGLPERADETEITEISMPPALELDISKYLPDIADIDATEAQKIEFLTIVWDAMRLQVELNFTVNICEQLFAELEEVPGLVPDSVPWTDSTDTEMPSGGNG
jgi:hypothetical protein